MDDKKCKFKDGTTTTEVVDLRYDSVNNRFTFHNDIGFLKAHGTEINSSSLPATLVTLNSLQSGGLLGIKSFSQTVQGLFPHRLIMAKGNVANFTVIHKDQTVDDTDEQERASAVNYGRASAMNETGAYNEFVLQNLTANSDEPVVLGGDMIWDFQNETAGSGLTFTADSYFYIEKVQTI